MENPNPLIIDIFPDQDDVLYANFDDSKEDDFTAKEIYNIIRNINDPEHPLTLEQLSVVSKEQISLLVPAHARPAVLLVQYTPTIPHCSMATLIGLCIRVQLERCLPFGKFLVKVQVRPGSHQTEADINKQLGDKERVAAALENEQLLVVVNQCLSGPPRMGIAL